MNIKNLFIVWALTATILLAEDFLPGGVFVKSAIDVSKINSVSPTKTDTLPLIIGKTYWSLDNILEVLTAEKQTAEFQFSNGALVKVMPSSEFRIDSFNSMVSNSDSQPEIAKFTDTLLNLALMNGESFIVIPSHNSPNTMCVLQTPLANIELNGSKVLVKASPKFVIAYIVEGKIAVIDSKTNKKEEIKQGQMAFIVPFPGESHVIVTSKAIEPGELLKQMNMVKELESTKESVIFAVIDKKIVGIRK